MNDINIITPPRDGTWIILLGGYGITDTGGDHDCQKHPVIAKYQIDEESASFGNGFMLFGTEIGIVLTKILHIGFH